MNQLDILFQFNGNSIKNNIRSVLFVIYFILICLLISISIFETAMSINEIPYYIIIVAPYYFYLLVYPISTFKIDSLRKSKFYLIRYKDIFMYYIKSIFDKTHILLTVSMFLLFLIVKQDSSSVYHDTMFFLSLYGSVLFFSSIVFWIALYNQEHKQIVQSILLICYYAVVMIFMFIVSIWSNVIMLCFVLLLSALIFYLLYQKMDSIETDMEV